MPIISTATLGLMPVDLAVVEPPEDVLGAVAADADVERAVLRVGLLEHVPPAAWPTPRQPSVIESPTNSRPTRPSIARRSLMKPT